MFIVIVVVSSSFHLHVLRYDPMKLIAVLVAVLLSGLEVQAETELFEAVRNGDARLVRTLIRSGADPDTRNELGVTPLMYAAALDRKSTRLNSSHLGISYAVFCLK